ncbi:MAG: methyltransferase [Candidatus Aenigmatarchaeota archaeon]
MIINPLSNDKKLCEFVKECIIKGYSNHKVPKKIVIQIIKVLEHKNLSYIFHSIGKIVKHNLFRNARKKYEKNRIRHRTIWKYIKNEIPKNSTILDVGCGKGDIGFVILTNRRIKKYIGSDIRLNFYTKRRKSEKIKFIQQPSETVIPIPNHSIDVILMIDLLHHVKPEIQLKLLKHVKNKLKPNGKIIIFEYTFSQIIKPMINNLIYKKFKELTLYQKLTYLMVMDWISNVLILKRKIPMPYAFRTFEEWKKIFKDVGYSIVKSKYIGFPEEFFHQGPYCLFILKH